MCVLFGGKTYKTKGGKKEIAKEGNSSGEGSQIKPTVEKPPAVETLEGSKSPPPPALPSCSEKRDFCPIFSSPSSYIPFRSLYPTRHFYALPAAGILVAANSSPSARRRVCNFALFRLSRDACGGRCGERVAYLSGAPKYDRGQDDPVCRAKIVSKQCVVVHNMCVC